MLAAIASIRSTWKPALAAMAVGGVLGWFLKPAPPQSKVELHDLRGYESDGSERLAQEVKSGPVDVKGRWTLYGPQANPLTVGGLEVPQPPANAVKAAPATTGGIPCPVSAVLEFEEHRGPVVTDTRESETRRERATEKLDLTITPAPPPGWALQLGLEDVLGRQVRVAVRRRLFGLGPCESIWVEGSVVPRFDRPLASTFGAALACEFGR